MKVLIALLLLTTISAFAVVPTEKIYEFSAKDIDGKSIDLSIYEGKYILIVNTASKCGFTYQYEELEKLYKEQKENGLIILGFPCNQFGEQEPGSSEEIKEFCSTSFGVTFPIFEKIDVNGDNANPIFKFLKAAAPQNTQFCPGEEKHKLFAVMGKMKPLTDGTEDIRWNFTKFLIGKDGKVIKRFEPTAGYEQITKYLESIK